MRIAEDDARRPDVAALIAFHVEDVTARMPPGEPNSFDLARLARPDVTLWSARSGDELVGIVAVKRMNAAEAELKSMRVPVSRAGRGIGLALLRHAIHACRAAGVRWLYLETATGPFFDRAADLYLANGFAPCAPFGDYGPSEHHRYMALDLAGPADGTWSSTAIDKGNHA